MKKTERKFNVGDEVIVILHAIKETVMEDDKGENMPYFVDMEDGHGVWFNEYELEDA